MPAKVIENVVRVTPIALVCDCGAAAKNNTRERGRFKRRHPRLCNERGNFAKQLAQDTKSVEDNSSD